MPKQKTKKSAAKRIKTTGTGKLRRHQAFNRHLRTKKNRKHKRRLGKETEVSSANRKQIERMMPYR